ncbi:MAG: rRNA maturation RNase YbeY [Desertimonas sp.]
MNEPPSPTVGTATVEVVAADEQHVVAIDVDRWAALARSVLAAEGMAGELTLTFVDETEIATLNKDHLGGSGPTDVLSFPLDADDTAAVTTGLVGVPVLLGDVVVCPAVAAAQAAAHAGTLDDEIALLVIHGVLHVLGHDHAEPGETARMRDREMHHLTTHHWHGPAPASFRQEHST